MSRSQPRPRSSVRRPGYPRHAIAAVVLAAASGAVAISACRPPGPPGAPPHVYTENPAADAAAPPASVTPINSADMPTAGAPAMPYEEKK